MNWYKISKMVKKDSRLMEGVKEVVDQGKLIGDVAEEYHLNPEELSDEVVDIRKEKSLPVNLILQLIDQWGRVKLVKEKLKEFNKNVSMDDIVWVLRRKRNTTIAATTSEIEKVIELKEQGRGWDEISRKTRLGTTVIYRIINKYRPDLLRPKRDKLFGDNIYLEYLNLTQKQGKTHNDSMKELMRTHNATRVELLTALGNRGLSFGEKGEEVTQADMDKIMNMAYQGNAIKDIVKEVKRSRQVIENLIKRKDIHLYRKISRPKTSTLSPDVLRFIIDSIRSGKKYFKIIDEVKNIYNIKIGITIIRTIRDKFVSPIETLPTEISEPVTSHVPQEIQDSPKEDDAVPFGGINIKPMSWEEYYKRKEKFLTKEEIEERQNPKQIASSLNWYRSFLKTAIKGTYSVLAGELAREAANIILKLFERGIEKQKIEDSAYCKSINKNIGLNINIDIDNDLERSFIMGGEYDSEPIYKDNRIIDHGRETILLNVFINPSIDFSRNDFYQELFYVIRHEVEHKRNMAETKLDFQELLNRDKFYSLFKSKLNSENLIDGYRASVDYLLYSLELEPIVRSVAYSAKKRGQNFEQLLRNKINDLLCGNNDKFRNFVIANLGINSVTETENKIINNFINIYNDIFKRTTKKAFNLYNIGREFKL